MSCASAHCKHISSPFTITVLSILFIKCSTDSKFAIWDLHVRLFHIVLYKKFSALFRLSSLQWFYHLACQLHLYSLGYVKVRAHTMCSASPVTEDCKKILKSCGRLSPDICPLATLNMPDKPPYRCENQK